jgi:hypothetical protein
LACAADQGFELRIVDRVDSALLRNQACRVVSILPGDLPGEDHRFAPGGVTNRKRPAASSRLTWSLMLGSGTLFGVASARGVTLRLATKASRSPRRTT